MYKYFRTIIFNYVRRIKNKQVTRREILGEETRNRKIEKII